MTQRSPALRVTWTVEIPALSQKPEWIVTCSLVQAVHAKREFQMKSKTH